MAGRIEGADAVYTGAGADDGGAVRDSDVRGSGIGDAEELSRVGDEALGGTAVDHGHLLVSVVVDEDGCGAGGVFVRRVRRRGVVLALRERRQGVTRQRVYGGVVRAGVGRGRGPGCIGREVWRSAVRGRAVGERRGSDSGGEQCDPDEGRCEAAQESGEVTHEGRNGVQQRDGGEQESGPGGVNG